MERKPARASVVQTVSAARIQSLNGRVALTGEPGNGENTTPKSIVDLLLSLDLRCLRRLQRTPWPRWTRRGAGCQQSGTAGYDGYARIPSLVVSRQRGILALRIHRCEKTSRSEERRVGKEDTG